MVSYHAMEVPPGSYLASGSAVVACEGRVHELAPPAVDPPALPDLGRAVACVVGGGGRAGEHGADQGHGEGRSHAQETSFPSRVAREKLVLLPAFARYRVRMLEKSVILWMLPVTTILLPSAAKRHSTLHNYVIYVPTIKTTIP